MRIVQLIDTLQAGGAEKMAVAYNNALDAKIEFSGLVVTRNEGFLKNEINNLNNYLFLNRKSTLDFKAFLLFRKYLKTNKIDIIHAHGTSFFVAGIMKVLLPRIKIIWHDHYGDSEFLDKRPFFVLRCFSYLFAGIVVVNTKLEIWAKNRMKCNKIIYLRNFVSKYFNKTQNTILNGSSGKRIVCLANIREQKGHTFLIDVAEKLLKIYPDWSFHLVGNDTNDAYSQSLKQKIIKLQLDSNIYFYGSRSDVPNILGNCDIAILTSKSEGLPVALLEYGLMQMPVVVTNVGEIPSIINNSVNGFLVDYNNITAFADAIGFYITNSEEAKNIGLKLYEDIKNNFSEEVIIKNYLRWIKNNI